MPKNFHSLVVSFSRTGETKKIADLVADTLGADKREEISESRRREGLLGYLRSAWEAGLGISPPINTLLNDPAQFDLVVLATPVWMGRMSSPMRTYLLKMESRLPRVAFVVTEGGSGGHRVLLHMRDLIRKIPVAELVLTEDEIRHGGHLHKVKGFCQQITNQFEKEMSPPAVSIKKTLP